jgi:hypothetical protein
MNVDPQLLRSILEIVLVRKRLAFVEPVRSDAFLANAKLLYMAGMITGLEIQDDSGWNLLEPELTELGSQLRERLTNPADWLKLNAQAPLWTRESGAEMLKEWQRRQAVAI